MKTKIDLANWNRREHFEFFSSFDEPFFGITTKVDYTKAFHFANNHQLSHFLCYLYASLKACNEIVEFRYRIEEDEVYAYESIHASPTIGRADHTFGFSFLEYEEDLKEFIQKAKISIAQVQQSKGLNHSADAKRLNTIHYSSIPWFDFTSISHARHYSFPDSIPKIAFGKYKEENGRYKLPVSIHVNHALMDGYHIGKYLTAFQDNLNNLSIN